MTTYQFESQHAAQSQPFYTAHGVSIKAVTYPIRFSAIYAGGAATYPGTIFPIVTSMLMNFYRITGVTTQSGTVVPTPAVRQGSPAATCVAKFDTGSTPPSGGTAVVGTLSERIVPQIVPASGAPYTWSSNLIILPGSAIYIYGTYGTGAGNPSSYYVYVNMFFEELRLSWSF
jgi:hypothetical protein